MSSLKVYLQVALPKRQPDPTKDGHFVCYDANSPIPWKEKIFGLTDDKSRMWFCHEYPKPITEAQNLANELRKEYPDVLKRNNPIVVNVIVVRANDLDELKNLLTEVEVND